jgi:hypothetical protein
MPISHSQSVASKGYLHNNNAVTLGTKGYIYIRIEEIPVPPPPKKGGSSGEMTKKFGKKEDRKKIIKVTVIYDKRKYVEAKVVDLDVKVTTKDIDVKEGEKLIIDINVEGVKLNQKDIEEL